MEFITINNVQWRPNLEHAQALVALNTATNDASRTLEKEVAINVWRWAEAYFVDKHGPFDILDLGSRYGTAALFTAITNTTVRARVLHNDAGSFTKIQTLNSVEFIEVESIEDEEIFGLLCTMRKANIIFLLEQVQYLHYRLSYLLRLLKDHAIADDGVIYLSFPDVDDYGKSYTFYNCLADIPVSPFQHSLVDRPCVPVWMYSLDEVFSELAIAGFKVVKKAVAIGPEGKHYNLALVKI